MELQAGYGRNRAFELASLLTATPKKHWATHPHRKVTNVPMYLVGATHPHKIDAQRMLERCVAGRIPLVTDAEVLQEILHRYTAIRRRAAIQPAFDVLLGIVDDVWAVDRPAVERAKAIVLEREPLSARDALHVALMERNGVTRIASFDVGFDAIPGIERLSS